MKRNSQDYKFKQSSREFLINSDDKNYKKVKKKETKRIKKAEEKHKRLLKKLKKQGKEWSYVGD